MLFSINTSNLDKQKEFRKFLGSATIFTNQDLREPDADSFTITCYKASQFEGVLVDDTSLEIKGAKEGHLIKWHLESLADHEGSPAVFKCYLGIKRRDQVEIFLGEVAGKVVAPQGHGFGFTPFFLPEGACKTLGEDRPNRYNARYFACQDFLDHQPLKVMQPLPNWAGKFQ